MLTRTTGIVIGIALALSGCAAADKFGDDPVDYYAQHPIKNKVESRTYVTDVALSCTAKLASHDVEMLSHQLHGISMPAVQSVTVGVPHYDAADEERKAAIARLLRHVGYSKGDVSFVTDETVQNGHAKITLNYASVILPACPDWSTSPVTSYSNTWQGNFRCAQEVNTGLMVADPHDLVEGTGDVPIPTSRAAIVIQNYNNGVTASAATVTPGTNSASSTAGSSAGASSGGSGTQQSGAQ